jgi:hypothetical protein
MVDAAKDIMVDAARCSKLLYKRSAIGEKNSLDIFRGHPR